MSYNVEGIDGQFVIPIQLYDDVQHVSSQIKKEFGIIPELKAKIYGSVLQSCSILSKYVREQDLVTFYVKESDKYSKLRFYRKPIINQRYQSDTTFIIYSTINFKSMTDGDKIMIDIENDTIPIIQDMIREMIKKKLQR